MKIVELNKGDTLIIRGAESVFTLQECEFVEYTTLQTREGNLDPSGGPIIAAFIKVGSIKFQVKSDNFKQESEK
jgi:hypothetical protein